MDFPPAGHLSSAHGKYSQNKARKLIKPHRLEKLPSSFPHPPPGPGSASAASSSNRNDEIKYLEKDLEILKRKLSDISNIAPTPENALLSRTSSAGGTEGEIRQLNLITELFTRMTALDREVLRKTSDGIPKLARRNSKPDSLGNDLHHLPTHLILIDRLLDYHTQLRRENTTDRITYHNTILTTTPTPTSSSEQQQSGEENEILVRENVALKRQLKILTTETDQKYETIERKLQELSSEYSDLRKSSQQSERESLNKIQRYEIEKKRSEEEMKRLREQISVLQSREQERQEQQQQASVPAVVPGVEDGQYSEEAIREIFLLRKELLQLKSECGTMSEQLNGSEALIADSLAIIKDSRLVETDHKVSPPCIPPVSCFLIARRISSLPSALFSLNSNPSKLHTSPLNNPIKTPLNNSPHSNSPLTRKSPLCNINSLPRNWHKKPPNPLFINLKYNNKSIFVFSLKHILQEIN
jgi:hypothetical protein